MGKSERIEANHDAIVLLQDDARMELSDLPIGEAVDGLIKDLQEMQDQRVVGAKPRVEALERAVQDIRHKLSGIASEVLEPIGKVDVVVGEIRAVMESSFGRLEDRVEKLELHGAADASGRIAALEAGRHESGVVRKAGEPMRPVLEKFNVGDEVRYDGRVYKVVCAVESEVGKGRFVDIELAGRK